MTLRMFNQSEPDCAGPKRVLPEVLKLGSGLLRV